MKRCSTCNRTYTDPSLSFCIDDGTPLTLVEDESTVVSPRTTAGGKDNDWNAVAYQPPGSYVPPGTQVPRRRAWPLVLGIIGAFILGIVVISVVAAILAPRLLRARQDQQARQINANANQAENANATEPANSNVDANVDVNVDTPPPADHEQVLAQLTDLENDWTVANLNADKKELDRILADDYVGPSGDQDGALQTKTEYIQTISRNTDVDKWEFSDLKLLLAGDRATLTGKIKYVMGDREADFDFKDKFVWRDGRWQATGSELKPRE